MNVIPSPSNDLAATNSAIISENNSKITTDFILINDFFHFNVIRTKLITTENSIGLNMGSRQDITDIISFKNMENVSSINNTYDIVIEIRQIIYKGNDKAFIYEESIINEIETHLKQNNTILDENRTYIIRLKDSTDQILAYKVKRIENAIKTPYFFINKVITVDNSLCEHIIKLKKAEKNVFSNFSIQNLSIGGLDKELEIIFRKAFLSRLYKKETVKKLGMSHSKGIILYGPPGTGKTLVARNLSKMLNCTTLKVVNGPEILDKYVGESERKMRELFFDAEQNPEEGLHVIIFDEIDSLCKSRSGSGETGNKDTIVNQLLTKMDGINSLNNILIIGMTNRIDIIDPALLRPGRFDIKLEIKLPNKEGRNQIFQIHTKKLLDNGFLNVENKESFFDKLSTNTENYTGAEIENIVKNATTKAMARDIDIETMKLSTEKINITEDDFDYAIQEFKPAFGGKIEDLFMSEIDETINIENFLFKNEKIRNPLYLCETEEEGYSLTKKLDYPNFVVINNYNYISLDGYTKSLRIKNIIDEKVIKSKKCVVIFNRIEELIEYFSYTQDFNKIVTNCIKTILNYSYKEENIIFVITTKEQEIIKNLLC